MKRIRIALILLLFTVFMLPLEPFSALAADNTPTASFDDVSVSDPNSPYIIELYQKKLIDGIADRKFGPNDLLNREQFAKMLVNAFRIPDGDGKMPFDDVTDEWAKPYVAAAYKANAIQGIAETKFGPLDSLTKQTAATIVYRWMVAQGVRPSSVLSAASAADADDWAKEAVAFVLATGLRAEGVSTAAYDSKKPMTRGEAAALIALSIRKLENRLLPAPQKPNASGASQAQAITMTSPGTMTDIPLDKDAWINTQLTAGRTVIMETQDKIAVTVLDKNGNYRADKTASPIRFEPLTGGDYSIILSNSSLNPIKSASLSITDGSSFAGAYPLVWKDGQAAEETRIPEKSEAFYRVELHEGVSYSAKIRASGTISSVELYDPVQQSVLSQTGDTHVFTAKRNGFYTLKIAVASDAIVQLTVSAVGGSKNTAVPLKAGDQEINALPDGTLWLSFQPLYGRYFQLELKGAKTAKAEGNAFKGDFEQMNSSLVMSAHFPISQNAYDTSTTVYVQTTAEPGATLHIRYEDGGSLQGAFILSSDNSMRSHFPVYKTYRDESFYYQVDLIGGRAYQIEMIEGTNDFDPQIINGQLDPKRFVGENGKTPAAEEPKLKILDSEQRELTTVSGRMPVFRPTRDGTYYLQLYPGTNPKGILLRMALQ